jgi:hypothetical protein
MLIFKKNYSIGPWMYIKYCFEFGILAGIFDRESDYVTLKTGWGNIHSVRLVALSGKSHVQLAQKLYRAFINHPVREIAIDC